MTRDPLAPDDETTQPAIVTAQAREVRRTQSSHSDLAALALMALEEIPGVVVPESAQLALHAQLRALGVPGRMTYGELEADTVGVP